MMISHPTMGTVNMTAQVMSDDPDEQVADTIALMCRYALEDSRRPEIIADVMRAGADPGSLWAWVKSKIQFTQDVDLSNPIPLNRDDQVVEVLVRPIDISRGASQGDCDDFSMYLSSLLTAARIPNAFVTVAADRANPRLYSHVYVAAYPNGQRVPLDASHGQHPGWEVKEVTRKTEWPVYSDGFGATGAEGGDPSWL